MNRWRFLLDQFDSPQVMQVNDALQLVALVDDHEGGDFLLLHEVEAWAAKASAEMVRGLAVMHWAAVRSSTSLPRCSSRRRRSPSLMMPTRVSASRDGGDAQAFARHLVDDLDHGSGGRDARDGIAGVHQLRDAGEALAEFAAGMQVGEVFGAEAAALAECDGQRVAQGEHGGGGGRGRKAERAGFLVDRAVESDIGGLGERGGGRPLALCRRAAGTDAAPAAGARDRGSRR